MFFRPNYCANCGEKIERANWGILTSRRFCQVCESEYKGQDLIPRAIVVLGVVLGLFGLGGYLRGDPAVSNSRSSLHPPRFAERQSEATPPSRVPVAPRANGAEATSSKGSPDIGGQREPVAGSGNLATEPVVRTVISEPSYICGAETKKGTPCSRRVKGNTRCFQHAGMPSMLAPGESKVSVKR
jgi:hypothetical protein